METYRFTTRECASGNFFTVRTAKTDEIERLAARGRLRWLTVAPLGGQAWLDAHRPRIDELRTTPPRRPPGEMRDLVVR